FPINTLLTDKDQNWDHANWSWLARLLPYLEQGNLYQQGNLPNNTLKQSAAQAATQLNVFLCPADPVSRAGPRTDGTNMGGFALGQTNYKGVAGANWGGWDLT